MDHLDAGGATEGEGPAQPRQGMGLEALSEAGPPAGMVLAAGAAMVIPGGDGRERRPVPQAGAWWSPGSGPAVAAP